MREVFAISGPGRGALKKLVEEAWTEPVRTVPTTLYGALAFRECLTPAEERAALDAAIDDLRAEIATWEGARPLKARMSRAREIMFDNGLAHLRADLELLEGLRALRGRRRA